MPDSTLPGVRTRRISHRGQVDNAEDGVGQGGTLYCTALQFTTLAFLSQALPRALP